MERWALALPVLVGWYMLVRVLDVDQVVLETVRDWWHRVRWTGRHSHRGRRIEAHERSRRAEMERHATDAALNLVWVGALAEWAVRARSGVLDRGRVAVRWT
jgi:hypothetical protein